MVEEAVDKLVTRGGKRPGAGPPGLRRDVPHGFRDFPHFQDYAGRLKSRIRERYPDAEIAFQGSAVTGRSHDTHAPFDEGRVSDFDVAVSGDSLNRAARDAGVPYRGDGVSTPPLGADDLRSLGLRDVIGDASDEAGRKVNVMIYRTMEEATARKPSIRVWF
ncbi:hypothetical protein GA0074704_5048 [Micromonospora siamensis]|uniref:Uncharacterized protein n=2 Tax=Micromonospora siamensis TaxID=299152 RepID=A0A1C5JW71_9ACTN|nr:hypothetical protein GA0074704_5048 [Micromonospora siamensis]